MPHMRAIAGRPLATHSALSFAPTSSYKHPFFQNRSLLDGQESKAPRVDNSPSSHAQDTGKKKNKGGKHRQDPKAERGRYPAKSIEYGTVAGLASLSFSKSCWVSTSVTGINLSLARCGLFL